MQSLETFLKEAEVLEVAETVLAKFKRLARSLKQDMVMILTFLDSLVFRSHGRYSKSWSLLTYRSSTTKNRYTMVKCLGETNQDQ